MTSNVSHVTRVLVLGEPRIGKTSLARTISNGVFPAADSLPLHSPHPNMECKTTTKTSILAGDTNHVIHILDAVEDLSEGTQVDVVYLCFDIGRQATFDAIETKWLPKAKVVNKAMKNKAQFLLIGLKADQAHTLGAAAGGEGHLTEQPITASVANELANQIQVSVYVETSSLKYLGIEKLKEKTVFRAETDDKPTKSSIFHKHKDKCLVM